MATPSGARRSRCALAAAAGLAYALLLAAPLAVLAYSLSPTAALEIPPTGVSLRWYAGLLDQPRLLSGLGTSVLLGLLATGGSLALGVAAALGLTRAALPGREAVLAFLLSPLSLPGLVLGVGLLTAVSLAARATGVQLAGTLAPLLAAHLVITLPWVVRSVAATLESADPALEEQARSLGAGPIAALFLVTLPGARAGILAGAVFAFVVSFGNFALSLFLVSGRTITLPVAIFESVDRYQDPTAAAISTVAILLTAGAALLADRLSGVLTLPAPRARAGRARAGAPAGGR